MEKISKKFLISFSVIIVVAIAAWSLSCLSSDACGFNTTNSEVTVSVPQSRFQGLISPSEFAELINTEGYIVLDLRSQSEYDEAHITSEPMLIDYYKEDFKDKLYELDKTKTYLIYCNSGNRSADTTSMMKELEFESFYELDGGISAWKAEGLDVY